MASPEPGRGFLSLRPLTPRERVIIILAFLILYGVGFTYWIYLPYTEEVRRLQTQLEQERSKLEAARAILHRLDEIEDRIRTLSAEMERLDLLVPGDDRAAHFLYHCWEWERATGARVADMVFSAPQDVGGYEEYTVSFTVVGTYEAQIGFLSRLEGMDRLVRVDAVEVVPKDAPGVFGSSSGDIVTAYYTVHLFADPSKAAQAAQEPPGEGLTFTLPVGRRNPFRP
ncbi:MAG TPA: hypothetical protein DHW14_03175 [Clostridiales bacterium]|nr:hypothetical protein [Clostridiales bacterium]